MDSENIHCCQLCHLEFETEDDLSLHKCTDIKQEFQDSKVLDFYDIGQNGDLELSEEFLSSIIKQVEDLCDSIQKGDPIIERAISVNQQITLIDSKNVEMGQDIWDDYDNLMESDTDYKPKIKNKAKKNKFPNADSMTLTSKVDKVTNSKVSMGENPNYKGFRALIPFLRYKNDHEIFECTICNKTFEKKIDMFQHLKSTHDSEITQKIAATKKKSFSKEHIDKMMDIVKF